MNRGLFWSAHRSSISSIIDGVAYETSSDCIYNIQSYLFKIIEKRKLNIDKNNQKKENDDINKKGIDAFKCDVCGLWSTGKKCNNKECTNY